MAASSRSILVSVVAPSICVSMLWPGRLSSSISSMLLTMIAPSFSPSLGGFGVSGFDDLFRRGGRIGTDTNESGAGRVADTGGTWFRSDEGVL